MKYFRFRKFVVDDFTTFSLEVPPNVTSVQYHDELAGVDIDDSEEILLFQHPECEVTEQTFEEVESELKNTHFYRDINQIVKTLIKNKYPIEEEISLMKRAKDDPEYIAYEEYVASCREVGNKLKIEKGLKCIAI